MDCHENPYGFSRNDGICAIPRNYAESRNDSNPSDSAQDSTGSTTPFYAFYLNTSLPIRTIFAPLAIAIL